MKILILSASTGGGHMTAAEALKSYILTMKKDSVVEVVDTLEYINPLLNKTVTESYLYMAKKNPKMFGLLYNTSNKENKFSNMVTFLNSLFSKRLFLLLKDFNADIIITTHMFPTEMVSNLKDSGKVNIPLVCVMTDYAPHKTWINKCVDAYIVANEDMVPTMVKMGAPIEKIHPFGIPINHSFYNKTDKNKMLLGLGLDPNIPTILIMAGSFGVTNILKIYDNIVNIDVNFQIIIITGKNEKLYNMFKRRVDVGQKKHSTKHVRIETIDLLRESIKHHSEKLTHLLKDKKKIPGSKKTRLIFFTDEVYKYMHISDLIITKPGGLTVSEALACDLPMAIFNAIPGQEEENAEFLVKNNMAIKIGKGNHCSNAIKNLLTNKESLDSMKNSCKSFDKSQSNENIFILLTELVDLSNSCEKVSK
ncbi:MAG: Processive diacylglycerol beta-glucosyltransferase [Eubacteriales bacterium SKADARSKE-1]|nr:Processive diacylglycerol beta-glucosyltransferase [Eubacteriales bacterium SKADARSKE-1]